MEAVLQQAGLLDDVESYAARPGGKTCGEARIALRGHEALARCVSHFQGMQWDDHVPVSVTALGPNPTLTAKPKRTVDNAAPHNLQGNSWAERAVHAPEWLPCVTESKGESALKTEPSTEVSEAESAEEDVRSNG